MKSPRSLVVALLVLLAGFIGVRVVPMKGLIARGGALEVLQLLRRIGVSTPDQYLVQIVLIVVLGLVTLALLVRLAVVLTGHQTPGSQGVLERPMKFVEQSSLSLFRRGGLLLRLLLGGACVFIAVLGVRRFAPLDGSALWVIANSQEHQPGVVAAAFLHLMDNNYSRYLRNVARLIKELNKSNPAVIVVPVQWWIDAGIKKDHEFLNEFSNVLQYRLPAWQFGSRPPAEKNVVVTEPQIVPTSLLERSRPGGWPASFVEWRPFGIVPLSSIDSQKPFMDVSVAAVLKAQHADIAGHFERMGDEFRIGPLTVPVDGEGRTYSPNPYHHVLAAGVSAREDSTGALHYLSLAGERDTLDGSARKSLDGKIVFVEYFDTGFPVPPSGFRTWDCVAITTSILQNSMVRRAELLEIVCLCAVVLLAVLLFRFAPYPAAVAGSLIVGIAFAGLAISLARSSGIFLQAFYFPGTALLCVLVLLLVRLVFTSGTRWAARDEPTI